MNYSTYVSLNGMIPGEEWKTVSINFLGSLSLRVIITLYTNRVKQHPDAIPEVHALISENFIQDGITTPRMG